VRASSVLAVDVFGTGYIDYVGLDMYREWKKIEFQKNIVYEFGNNMTKR
jgi:hypothetical protein